MVMATRKSAAKKTAARKKTASRRELVAPKGDKRFVRRGKAGQFKKVVGIGRSLSTDKKRKAKKKVPKGQGDRGETQ